MWSIHTMGYSVQFSLSVVSYSLQPHGLQHARPPFPSPALGAYSNSCPLSRWCHPTISSSAVPFPSCLQSFPASGSFPVSQFFTSGGQSIGVSASASVLPMNSQDWFPFRWTGWISLQSKGLSRVFSNTTVQKHQFFSTHHVILFIFKEKWSDSFYNVDESQKHNAKWKELITKDHRLYHPVIWSHLLEISRTGKPVDTESKCMIVSAGRRREEWMTA